MISFNEHFVINLLLPINKLKKYFSDLRSVVDREIKVGPKDDPSWIPEDKSLCYEVRIMFFYVMNEIPWGLFIR